MEGEQSPHSNSNGDNQDPADFNNYQDLDMREEDNRSSF